MPGSRLPELIEENPYYDKPFDDVAKDCERRALEEQRWYPPKPGDRVCKLKCLCGKRIFAETMDDAVGQLSRHLKDLPNKKNHQSSAQEEVWEETWQYQNDNPDPANAVKEKWPEEEEPPPPETEEWPEEEDSGWQPKQPRKPSGPPPPEAVRRAEAEKQFRKERAAARQKEAERRRAEQRMERTVEAAVKKGVQEGLAHTHQTMRDLGELMQTTHEPMQVLAGVFAGMRHGGLEDWNEDEDEEIPGLQIFGPGKGSGKAVVPKGKGAFVPRGLSTHTRLCRHWVNGNCDHGRECRFSHPTGAEFEAAMEASGKGGSSAAGASGSGGYGPSRNPYGGPPPPTGPYGKANYPQGSKWQWM